MGLGTGTRKRQAQSQGSGEACVPGLDVGGPGRIGPPALASASSLFTDAETA